MSQDLNINIRQTLAKNIKVYRVKKKMTREELSLILGFDNSYISKLEKGNVNITIYRLAAIASALETDVKNLF
ncbi:MAG: helix-turn-helix transcriptional regulator [Candidatus Gastranaerophilales bacterium]|nr:helix-turn-helix transcriptional regulator [Candidatus Gastranaerophilales bacterium]